MKQYIVGLAILGILLLVFMPSAELTREMSNHFQYIELNSNTSETCYFSRHTQPYGFIVDKAFPQAKKGDKFSVIATLSYHNQAAGTYYNQERTATVTAYQLDNRIVINNPFKDYEVRSCYKFKLIKPISEQTKEHAISTNDTASPVHNAQQEKPFFEKLISSLVSSLGNLIKLITGGLIK